MVPIITFGVIVFLILTISTFLRFRGFLFFWFFGAFGFFRLFTVASKTSVGFFESMFRHNIFRVGIPSVKAIFVVIKIYIDAVVAPFAVYGKPMVFIQVRTHKNLFPNRHFDDDQYLLIAKLLFRFDCKSATEYSRLSCWST